jgi:hypothetical protein
MYIHCRVAASQKNPLKLQHPLAHTHTEKPSSTSFCEGGTKEHLFPHTERSKKLFPLLVLSAINSRGLREGVKKKHNNRTVG